MCVSTCSRPFPISVAPTPIAPEACVEPDGEPERSGEKIGSGASGCTGAGGGAGVGVSGGGDDAAGVIVPGPEVGAGVESSGEADWRARLAALRGVIAGVDTAPTSGPSPRLSIEAIETSCACVGALSERGF